MTTDKWLEPGEWSDTEDQAPFTWGKGNVESDIEHGIDWGLARADARSAVVPVQRDDGLIKFSCFRVHEALPTGEIVWAGPVRVFRYQDARHMFVDSWRQAIRFAKEYGN